MSNNKLNSDNVYFIRGRKKALFDNSKILLKEQCIDETYVSASFHDYDSIYVNGVSSISFNDENLTKFLYSYFISDVISYILYMSSCSWGVGTRPAIRFQDEFLGFPFADAELKIRNTLVGYVDEFISTFKEYYGNSIRMQNPPINKSSLFSINQIINQLYEIKDYEKDLIDYTLNISRYQFQQSKQYLVTNFNDSDHRNQNQVLEGYADVYIKEFEEIYYDEFVKVEIFPMRHFIAMNFIITDKEPKEKISYIKNSDEKDVLKRLANNLTIEKITDTNDPSKNLYIQKDIKGFERDSFYIIKPNEYKCWHRAMAWYDVAEFKQAIQEAELKRLNTSSAND